MDEAAKIIGQELLAEASDNDPFLGSNLKTSASGLSIVDSVEYVDRILGTKGSFNFVAAEESRKGDTKIKPVADQQVALDWKGDPMKINPKDKFPRFL